MPSTRRFLADDSGLETVEYAIIVGFIVSGLIVLVVSIARWVKTKFLGLPQRPA